MWVTLARGYLPSESEGKSPATRCAHRRPKNATISDCVGLRRGFVVIAQDVRGRFYRKGVVHVSYMNRKTVYTVSGRARPYSNGKCMVRRSLRGSQQFPAAARRNQTACAWRGVVRTYCVELSLRWAYMGGAFAQCSMNRGHRIGGDTMRGARVINYDALGGISVLPLFLTLPTPTQRGLRY